MLNNGSSTSAGVYTNVNDNTVRGVAVSSSIGAMVGPSTRGPVGVPTLCTSQQNFRSKFGVPTPRLTYAHFCAEHFLSEANQLYFARVARNAKYGSTRIATVDHFSVSQPSVNGYDDPSDYSFNESDILFLHAANPGHWNNDLSVLMYPDTFDRNNELFVIEIFEGNTSVPVETYRVTLRETTDGYGRQTCIKDVLEVNDSRIRAVVNYNHPSLRSNPALRLINAVVRSEFSFGHDGDAVTIDDIIEGWDLYEDTEEITVTLLINGGYAVPAVQQKMLDVAERRGDAFAILDTPSDMQTTQQAIAYRRNTLNVNSSFGALYLPDLQVTTADNVQIWVPPSGYIGAVYARTDRIAAPWFAPAGITRGKVGANAVRHTYRQGDRDALDQNQINFVHKMPGHGLVVWSQETLQSIASALSNIHVRRLVNTLQATIRVAALSGVYEQNDSILRMELRRICDDILAPVKRGRGLYGYEVVCDETNNPPEYIASGDCILDVYIDPMMMTKRIHLNANVVRTGQVSYQLSILDR